MPTIIPRTYISEAELTPRQPEPSHRAGSATLVFYRAPGEGIRRPVDVVELLTAEDIETGTLRARNPVTHDQWWIPISVLAMAGRPYAKALASVAKA